MGIGGIKTGIDNHCFIEPNKRILISFEPCLLIKRRKLVFLFLFGKLTRNTVKYCKHFIFVSFGEFCYIISVKL